MEHEELKHFISQQLAGGTSAEEIKTLLAHHGWSPEAIEANFAALNKPLTPATVATVANEADAYTGSKAKRTWGIVLMALPTVMILVAMIGYAVAQFIIAKTVPTAAELGAVSNTTGLGVRDQRETIASILNVGLGLLGILGVLGMFIFIPLGLVLLAKSRGQLKDGVAYDERSGKGEASVIPPEISGWNWGAAILSLWWGAYFNVWIMLLVFVPPLSSIWWIVLGLKGNEWAWSKNKWLSVEQFKRSQAKWNRWGLIFFIFSLATFVLFLVALMGLLFFVAPSIK